MISVVDAYKQVLARLAASLDSPDAELPSGDGPADTPEITSEEQIVKYLDEGQKLLAKTPLLELRGVAAITGVGIGERRWAMSEATLSDPLGRTAWAVVSAAWTPTGGSTYPLERNEGRYYDIHHPNPLTETAARPRRIYDTGTHILIGPKPDAAGALALEVLHLPKTAVIGGNLDDIPDEKVHHVVSFACWRVCEQNIGDPVYAAALPLWRSEISWAAPFLGAGA